MSSLSEPPSILANMTRDLTGKHILITGASSGIGEATALACAQAGMSVTLAARREAKLQTAAEKINQAVGNNDQTHTVCCDVNSDDDTAAMYAAAWERFGRLDAIFANAGYGIFASMLEMTEQQHRDIFETNYFATLRTLKAGIADIRRTADEKPDALKHLLICSSAASEIGLPMFGAYCATKAAQDCIAGAMRSELAAEGVEVTSVHPVGTKTEFLETAEDKSGRETVGVHTPDGFTQTAEHVAKCIVKSLRKPRAEVWPSPIARIGLAMATAVPGITHAVIKRQYRKQHP